MGNGRHHFSHGGDAGLAGQGMVLGPVLGHFTGNPFFQHGIECLKFFFGPVLFGDVVEQAECQCFFSGGRQVRQGKGEDLPVNLHGLRLSLLSLLDCLCQFWRMAGYLVSGYFNIQTHGVVEEQAGCTVVVHQSTGLVKDEDRIPHYFYQTVACHRCHIQEVLAEYSPSEKQSGDGETKRGDIDAVSDAQFEADIREPGDEGGQHHDESLPTVEWSGATELPDEHDTGNEDANIHVGPVHPEPQAVVYSENSKRTGCVQPHISIDKVVVIVGLGQEHGQSGKCKKRESEGAVD